MSARIADEDEKTDAKEELGDSGEVEGSRVREERHDCGVV